MALNFGDHASGFRHNEVIRFINNEVLINGGGPEFYMTFRSKSWNEVEDGLRTVVADSQVPRCIKRACTWSALALGVRVVARQRERQTPRMRRLREQLEERERACWTLASELQRLREERDEAASQLHYTRTALQQAMDEREVLRGRLLQAERSAQDDPLPQTVVPGPGAERLGVAEWSMNAEEQTEVVAKGAQDITHLEAQMLPPAASLYVPVSPRPLAQVVQPHLQMPVPHQIPFHPPLPVELPYSTPVPSSVVMESEVVAAATATPVAAVAPQMPPVGIYPPGLWAPVRSQEMAPVWDQSCHCQDGYPENLPGRYHYNQKEGRECPQGMTSLGNSKSQSQKEGPERPQGTDPLGDSHSQCQKEDPVMPQWMAPLRKSSHSQKENLVMSQGTAPLGVSNSHSQQEDLVMPQGDGRSHRQEKGPKKSQAIPQGNNKSHGVKKSPKKQQAQQQQAKQLQGKKALESQQQKSASCSNQVDWVCPGCKAVNLTWHTACYKCKKVCVPVESGRQTD